MKVLVYHGAKDVRIADKQNPEIKDKEDIILSLASTAFCVSDVYLYLGTVRGMEPGETIGHDLIINYSRKGTSYSNIVSWIPRKLGFNRMDLKCRNRIFAIFYNSISSFNLKFGITICTILSF